MPFPEERDRIAVEKWDSYWRSREPVRRGRLTARLMSFLVRRGDFSRLILEQLEAGGLVRPGALVLEAGCGSGEMLHLLTSRGVPCVGADTSRTAARCASDNSVGGVRASVTALPFRDGAFAGAFSVGLLDQLSDRSLRASVEELCRSVIPGGSLVLVNSSARSWVHRSVMRILAARGRWPWGEKSHFESLEPLILSACPGCSVAERELGWLLQWRILSYLFSTGSIPGRSCNGISLVLNALLWPLNRFPGMVLATSVRVPSDRGSRSGGLGGGSG